MYVVITKYIPIYYMYAIMQVQLCTHINVCMFFWSVSVGYNLGGKCSTCELLDFVERWTILIFVTKMCFKWFLSLFPDFLLIFLKILYFWDACELDVGLVGVVSLIRSSGNYFLPSTACSACICPFFFKNFNF